MFKTGEILSVDRHVCWHYMIVVGTNSVIHATKKGGVVRSNLSDEIAGRVVRNHGRWTTQSDAEVVGRAYEMIGKPYGLLTQNCEHFVRLVSGIKVESPQLQFAVLSMCICWAIYLLANRRAA